MGFLKQHLKLIIMLIATLIVVNASIFGTLWLIEYLKGPTQQELYDLRQAEVESAQQALYDQLEPLETKSRVGYLSSMGEAIAICEEKLNAVRPEGKSSQVKLDSRYIESQGKYIIFIEFQTLAKQDQPSEAFEVTCDVLEEKGNIDNWKISPLG